MKIEIVIDDRFVDFGKKWFTRRTMFGAMTIGILIPLAIYADVPNPFEANTVISASEMNENFSDLDARIGVYERAISTNESSGNVGIGVAEPTVKLDVAGSLSATGTVSSENINHLIWETADGGTYDLDDIFRDARENGLNAGVYDCVLRTSNQAHWTGYRLTVAVNSYPDYQHKRYNVFSIAAYPQGCSGQITAFDADTGVFDFIQGNCNQSIGLRCNRLF